MINHPTHDLKKKSPAKYNDTNEAQKHIGHPITRIE